MSLVKGGPDALQAKKLYDWILGKTAMETIAKWYVIPLSSAAAATDTGFELAKMKLVDQDDQWDAKNKARLLEKWNAEVPAAGKAQTK